MPSAGLVARVRCPAGRGDALSRRRGHLPSLLGEGAAASATTSIQRRNLFLLPLNLG